MQQINQKLFIILNNYSLRNVVFQIKNKKPTEMPVDERIARSVALEQTYVHDVYEQFWENPSGKPWPKVQRFLDALEPGSIVCDVGKKATKTYRTKRNALMFTYKGLAHKIVSVITYQLSKFANVN